MWVEEMRPYARIPAARASRSAKVHLPAIRWERRLPIRTSAVRQSTASTIRTAVAVPTMWMFQARRPVAVRRQSARHLQSDRIAKQSVYHRIKEPRWSCVLCRGMVLQGEKVCSI